MYVLTLHASIIIALVCPLSCNLDGCYQYSHIYQIVHNFVHHDGFKSIRLLIQCWPTQSSGHTGHNGILISVRECNSGHLLLDHLYVEDAALMVLACE